jgi:thiol-disulfide isomerase/thioredoxin
VLWQTVLVGVAVARLAFVYEFRRAYLASPLDILDIRDGGWNATAGFIGAWLFALSRLRRKPALSRPLRWSLMTGTVLFVAGNVALSMRPGSQPLPALSFSSLEGQMVQLDKFAGKPTVINLWATWCPPCARETPVLRDAQVARRDMNFVFLNQGESAEKVRTRLEERGFALSRVLIDGKGQASAAFNQKGHPTTLFFDAKGQLAGIRVGELSSATLQRKLERIAPTADSTSR